jgi:hypothetical protein
MAGGNLFSHPEIRLQDRGPATRKARTPGTRDPVLHANRLARPVFNCLVGRECPELPCNLVFDDDEWKAVYIVSQKKPPPETPSTLNSMIRMIAGFGDFLNRAADGLPGPQTIWIGLQRSKDFMLAIESHRRALDPGCG